MSLGLLMQKNVRLLLNVHGYDITFRREVQGAYDPTTGQTGPATQEDETVRAIYLNYEASEIDGTAVQRGDRKAVIATPTTKTPQQFDLLIGEGKTVSVVSVQTIKSNENVLAYICQVRQ